MAILKFCKVRNPKTPKPQNPFKKIKVVDILVDKFFANQKSNIVSLDDRLTEKPLGNSFQEILLFEVLSVRSTRAIILVDVLDEGLNICHLGSIGAHGILASRVDGPSQNGEDSLLKLVGKPELVKDGHGRIKGGGVRNISGKRKANRSWNECFEHLFAEFRFRIAERKQVGLIPIGNSPVKELLVVDKLNSSPVLTLQDLVVSFLKVFIFLLDIFKSSHSLLVVSINLSAAFLIVSLIERGLRWHLFVFEATIIRFVNRIIVRISLVVWSRGVVIPAPEISIITYDVVIVLDDEEDGDSSDEDGSGNTRDKYPGLNHCLFSIKIINF